MILFFVLYAYLPIELNKNVKNQKPIWEINYTVARQCYGIKIPLIKKILISSQILAIVTVLLGFC